MVGFWLPACNVAGYFEQLVEQNGVDKNRLGFQHHTCRHFGFPHLHSEFVVHSIVDKPAIRDCRLTQNSLVASLEVSVNAGTDCCHRQNFPRSLRLHPLQSVVDGGPDGHIYQANSVGGELVLVCSENLSLPKAVIGYYGDSLFTLLKQRESQPVVFYATRPSLLVRPQHRNFTAQNAGTILARILTNHLKSVWRAP
eukprot:5314691-Amphidinium_carterae.3